MSDYYHYIFLQSVSKAGYVVDFTTYDPYLFVAKFDQTLYCALTNVFRTLDCTSSQKRELLHDPRSLLKLILEQEPFFVDIFSLEYEAPLLWVAVLGCYQSTAELLVRSGANVNELLNCLPSQRSVLNEKSTILQASVMMYPSMWNEQFIHLLLEHGADLNAQDSHGRTALHLAMSRERVQLAAILLKRGADVNTADENGLTPLLKAARRSKADKLLPLLIGYGADINVRDNVGSNVLHYLAWAPEHESIDLARVLIERGVLINAITRQRQYQPIHGAILKGKNELVKLFLDHGADVNARAGAAGEDEREDTFPLIMAANSKNPKVLHTLLKYGANIDLQDSRGRTALHIACNQSISGDMNWEKKMKILLSVGADMFVKDRYGVTRFAHSEPLDVKLPSIRLMIRTMALRKASLQLSTTFKDEDLMKKEDPSLWSYYQECLEIVHRMKSIRFVENCTFFDLLAKCECQIVGLILKNPEFESKFKQYDLDDFSMYASDVHEAFERAYYFYLSMLDMEDTINELVIESVGYSLPCPVRKILPFLSINCEACNIKKTVQESRRTPRSIAG